MLLGILFIGLAVLFAAFAITYLIANDFAKETMEVVFPATGAILVSFYLGFKAIYIDAPAPEHFGGPVAIMLDSKSGTLRGVPHPSLLFPSSLDEYRGAKLIGELPLYIVFGPLQIQERLKERAKAGPPKFIAHIIEYAILTWLGNPDVLPGVTERRFQILISGGGGSVGLPSDLVEVPTTGLDLKSNPLIAADPVHLRLPKGSSISRYEQRPFSVQIPTRHSLLRMRLAGVTAELLGRPLTPEADRLYKALGIPSGHELNLTMYAYDIDFDFSQSSFRRFSREAKKERQWAARLRDQFARDFSWNYVRARVLGAAM
jgi:hypothetical protein